MKRELALALDALAESSREYASDCDCVLSDRNSIWDTGGPIPDPRNHAIFKAVGEVSRHAPSADLWGEGFVIWNRLLRQYDAGKEYEVRLAGHDLGEWCRSEVGKWCRSGVDEPAGPRGKSELRAEWLAKAMLLVRDHPDWSDAEIARQVGKDKSTLSRSREFRAAAAMVRGVKDDRDKGHISVDPDSGLQDVEAYSDDPAETDWDD